MGGSGTSFKNGDEPEGYNERKVMNSVSSIVSQHIDSKVEYGYAIGLDGTILSRGKPGTEDECEIENAQDVITVHNHPNGGTFSSKDILNMAGISNGYITICYDRDRMYFLRRIGWQKGGSSKETLFGNEKDYREFARDYEKAINESFNRAYEKVKEMAMRGEVRNNAECRAAGLKLANDSMRTWLKNHSGEYGFEYSERTHK